ncbi:MAG: hypothetical protein ABID45_01010, partial [Patescibacteria group bacterium]
MKKYLPIIIIVCLLILPKLSLGVDFLPGDGAAGTFDIDLGNAPPYMVAAFIINGLLGFLGLFSLVLLLYGGYMWMNARGNEEQVTKAKKIIESAGIGLIIILSSYGLSRYVFDNLVEIT